MTILALSPSERARSAEYTPPLGIFADLMPDEVLVTRRVRDLKRKVGIGLVGVLVVLFAWYGESGLTTSSAKDDLASAQQQANALRVQQSKYAPLVLAQGQATQISASLRKLMAGDVVWTNMLNRIRAAAKSGITVTNIQATISASTSSGLSVLNQTGKQQIGTLAITGIAPDQDSIANYVEALGQIKGIAAPFPASLGGVKPSLTYSINAIITADALGGRFSSSSQGGK